KLTELDLDPALAAAIAAAIAGAANIRLFEETLSPADPDALVATAAVVLSLHRAEGFGLRLAVAGLVGRPVVGTGRSGKCVLMDAASSAPVAARLAPISDRQHVYDMLGKRWAEPDLGAAAAWLRRLSADPELRRSMGRAAAATDFRDQFRRSIA